MRPVLLAFLALGVPFVSASSAQGGPAVAGITTLDTGIGSGPTLAGSGLVVSYGALGGTLDFSLAAPTCCNVIFTGHYLVLGSGVLPFPIPLQGLAFFPQSQLYTNFVSLIGPYVGAQSSVAVPRGPGLVGLTVDVQGLPQFFTTITGATQFGTTQLVSITFQ